MAEPMTDLLKSLITFDDLATVDVGLPGRGPGVNAVMVGAGFSRALQPTRPSWSTLVERVWRKLEPKTAYPSGDIDPRIVAMRLSWRHAKRHKGAEQSKFQTAVAEVLTDAGGGEQLAVVARGFARFLKAARANVIIDLNYDDSVESVLRQERLPYIRAIGTDTHWMSPFAAADVLLWKLHGSTQHPETIVLSPTEYQRVYESNDLAGELIRFGKALGSLWTVGVGLEDDDVWAYVCSPESTFDIIPLWFSADAGIGTSGWIDRAAQCLESWYTVAESPKRQIRVLCGPLSEGSDALLAGLGAVSKVLEDGDARPYRARAGLHLDGLSRDRAIAFQREYDAAVGRDNTDAIRAVVKDHRADYSRIYNYLLCRRADGLGEQWLAGTVDLANRVSSHGDSAATAALCDDLSAILRASLEMAAAEGTRDETRMILVVAAAQAAIVYALELAEVLGIPVQTSSGATPTGLVGKSQSFLVGMNPFIALDLEQFNPMHVFKTTKAFRLSAGLWGTTAATATSRLLTEDEWEAAVQQLFMQSRQTITIGKGDLIELTGDVPPLYPWGFRFLDIREHRARNSGSISRRWHLVQKHLEGARQVCKGGGLRDRNPLAFQIGFRGTVRAGEYDPFVEAARF
jgi:hypothetical protein